MPSANPQALAARHRTVIPLAFLFLLVLMAFWPVFRNGFVEYDDAGYVTDNPHVEEGLTLKNIAWAFETGEQTNWHPLTWLSHMLDCDIFGLRAWGHHLTSLLLHTASTLLLFLLLRQLTAANWRSFLVAALFGLHPLRVESVAWASERKDVLSMFFLLLTLLSYAEYVNRVRSQKSGVRSQKSGARGRESALLLYVFSIVFFALGLMSKPMLVSGPFILLLLDYWPFERFNVQSSKFKVQSFRLVFEKLPFFLLAGASCVVTFLVQQRGGAVMELGRVSFALRVQNALVSYCRYLGKLFWPVNLDVFYPITTWPHAAVAAAAFLLAGLSLFTFLTRRSSPWLFVGWWWFVVTLIPVIGLVQVGSQAMADRYSYLPSIGILILTVWGVADLAERVFRTSSAVDSGKRRQGRGGPEPAPLAPKRYAAAAVLGGVLLTGCIIATNRQLAFWRDAESLCRHSLSLTPGNFYLHNLLGSDLFRQQRFEEAIHEFQTSIEVGPENRRAHILLPQAKNQFGMALLSQNNLDQAAVQFEEAVKLAPSYAEAHNNLGLVFCRMHRVDAGIAEFREAIRFKPEFAGAHCNLGLALIRKGDNAEAAAEFRKALQLQPDFPVAAQRLRALEEMHDAADH